MAPIFTGFRFGFGRGESDVPTLGFEYVLFGGTSGTIVVPSSISSIKIAGCGGGVNGNLQGPGQPEYGGGNGGGGAASNIIGNSFPKSGVTSLYYFVGSSGQDSYVQSNGPGGTDIIRLRTGSGTSGGPVTGGGPNAIAGGSGGLYGIRDVRNGSPGTSSPSSSGCGGGGGGGTIFTPGDSGLGGPGGAGGAFTGNPNALTSLVNHSGPAPNTWSFNISPVSTSPAPSSATTQGQSFAYAYGGRSASGTPNPGAVGGKGGGAGVGIKYIDPTSIENGNYFGGGGGGDGYLYTAELPSTNARQGGKGILVIQLIF